MALNEAEMKVGDIAMLNAGGPSMAIESLFDGKIHRTANCVWFTLDGMCQRGEFMCCMLVVAPVMLNAVTGIDNEESAARQRMLEQISKNTGLPLSRHLD
jgi:uncharacterized protein YodC (DUF2158 family)